MTKERTDVLPLTFLVKIENMRESSHSSDGFMLGLGRMEEATGVSGDAHLHPGLGAWAL